MAIQFPAGAVASINTLTAGTPGTATVLVNVKSIGGSAVTRAMADVTAITVNLSTGSTIDDLFQYDGYVTEVGEPEIAASDDALQYTVTLQRSDKY